MDTKTAGKSPMAYMSTKSKKNSVTTPTRPSFLSRLAEASVNESEQQPPDRQTSPVLVVEEDIDDIDIGRISPIPRRKNDDIEIPEIVRPTSPHIPSIYEDDVTENVETITREHLSPTKNNFVDIDDDDEIQERVTDLINDPGKIDYNLEQEEIQLACIETFRIKFTNLKINYPEREIAFPEGKGLNKIHDIYHAAIKSIYVNMNLGQLQLGYIIVLMAIEFLCVKAFNVPLAGFTKMELKRMYRYNQLMVELGENLYSAGNSQWPIEWRIFSTLAMNIVIFVALKFLAQYVGGESMTEVIRNAVDKVLDNPVTKDNIESGTAPKSSGSTADGLGSMMEGMMGGGDGGGMADLITSLGTGFTQKMENASKKGKGKRKFVFEE
jgi:hypothetical protein